MPLFAEFSISQGGCRFISINSNFLKSRESIWDRSTDDSQIHVLTTTLKFFPGIVQVLLQTGTGVTLVSPGWDDKNCCQ